MQIRPRGGQSLRLRDFVPPWPPPGLRTGGGTGPPWHPRRYATGYGKGAEWWAALLRAEASPEIERGLIKISVNVLLSVLYLKN